MTPIRSSRPISRACTASAAMRFARGSCSSGSRSSPLGRAGGASLSLACEKKLHGITATGMLKAVIEGGGEGLWLGDLPALLECEETPPAWPLRASDDARRAARQRLEALGRSPYLAV